MSLAKALRRAEKVAARKTGVAAFYVPSVADEFSRAPLQVGNVIPVSWIAVNVLEDSIPAQPSNDYSIETGALGANADVLPGERPERRNWTIVNDAQVFATPPKVGDRLIIAATSQNWLVEKINQTDVVGTEVITYGFICRELQ